MASGLNEQLALATARLDALAQAQTELYTQLAAARSEEASLRHEVEALNRQVAQLESDMRFLRVSHRLAASPDALVEARRMVAGLIRNIDKAIADLKE